MLNHQRKRKFDQKEKGFITKPNSLADTTPYDITKNQLTEIEQTERPSKIIELPEKRLDPTICTSPIIARSTLLKS